jgi:hypothetical protein
MKRLSYRKTTNAHYEDRKDDRGHQVWKKATKTGKPSRTLAASKGEVGAIPVKVY